jgi:hypothetical protein
MSDYWQDVVSEALEAAGLVATRDQIDEIAASVAMGHECYGQAHGHGCIPNPIELENKQLREQLKREESLVFCRECQGRGSITENAGGIGRSSTSQCWKCNGMGKRKP